MHYFWGIFEKYFLLHELHSERRYWENMYTHALDAGDEPSMAMCQRHIESVCKDLERVSNEWSSRQG